MTQYFEITDDQLLDLKGKVIIITGCASGIGLATTKILLAVGAKIIAGDLNPPPVTHDALKFQITDVASWKSLISLFELAHSSHDGRIDHVFANAGIGERTSFLDLQIDPATGELMEPNYQVLDINLRGVMNTAALAFHYMHKQQPPTGSVVMTAGASSFQRFLVVDYASAKHGVLGFMRGMVPVLKMAGSSIRVNAIAPSWTRTGLVPEGAVEATGKATQSADAAARSVLILMADKTRNGQLIYSEVGKYREIDEAVLLKANQEILGDELDDNVIMERILDAVKNQHALGQVE